MSDETSNETPQKRFNIAVFLPALAFLGLAALFAVMLLQPGRDTSTVPSVLIGKPAPQTPLPAIPGATDANGAPLPGFDPATFGGKPVLVNIWASWCGPCREEHPLLMALAEKDGVVIAGLNYKDKAENAAGFLRELGNPYDQVGADSSGRAAIEWGVYGVPETFVVGTDGTILYKHVGPLNPGVVERELLPRLGEPAAGG
ncbi:DsbE family thiol:disulfide interchange protein [Oricola cellulosilytica]|uniref:DsbE family thiol:disulfide interchange protein n=1 Tax=Oricola cellulosilytica TaxID=1429082 RepID=A0A4R0PDN1_9HYPH|nr:DsbE family thiol:disulfide interchange protein [Oricola cellulosilytica]TCD15876.1 DsbE family thiol:disulfide interchange protein [Oricola cellulosilytica]